MSKILKPSLRTATSNVGLLIEDNEKLQSDVMSNGTEVVNGMRRGEVNYFPVPRITKPMNPTFKSRFLHNVESSLMYEDLSKIDCDTNDYESFNAPSTSAVSFQQPRLLSRNLHSNHYRFGNSDEGSHKYRSASNKFITSSVQQPLFAPKFQKKIEEINSKILDNEHFFIPQKFGLGMKNGVLSNNLLAQNNSRIIKNNGYENNVDLTSNTQFDVESRVLNIGGNTLKQNISRFDSGNYTNKIALSKMYGLRSNATSLDISLSNERNERFCQNQMTNSKSFNGLINMPNIRRTFGAGSRHLLTNIRSPAQDRLKYGEELICGDSFSRPVIPRSIRPTTSTVPSHLFSCNSFEKSNTFSNHINGYSSTHLSRREIDSISELRPVSTVRRNQTDVQSITGSFMSLISVKAQVTNILENLHHAVLNIAPDISVDAIRNEFDKAKKVLENINETSFAPTIKEIDATSVISHSSKYKNLALDKPPESVFDNSVSLKTAKDILQSVVLGNSSALKALPRIEEEQKFSSQAAENQFSGDEKDDSALLFKKPKPYCRIKKKSSNTLKIKTPHVEKNKNGKKSQIINLKQWYPFSVGSDLTFYGTNEHGVRMQTVAVKKRLNNRKMELINGLNCNLIGSPCSITISVFPKTIATQLKNGLTNRWRLLQKNLLKHQTLANRETPEKSSGKKKSAKKSKNLLPETEISETTPKTIRNITLKTLKTSKQNCKDSPKKKNSTEKKKKKNSPLKRENEKKVKKLNILKNNKILQDKSALDGAEKLDSGKKSSKEAVKVESSRTRSGRSVKPPCQFWILPEKNRVTSTSDVQDTPMRKNAFKHSKTRPPDKESSGENMIEEVEEVSGVQSPIGDEKLLKKSFRKHAKRKRECAGEADSTTRKKSKPESLSGSLDESAAEKKKSSKNDSKSIKKTSTKAKKDNMQFSKRKKENNKKSNNFPKNTSAFNCFEDDNLLRLDDIEIPEIPNVICKENLSRNQMRLVSMETPPLKYFNNNLKLLKSSTPAQSPDWCISQRTDSEVKRFQKRRALVHKKKVLVEKKKTVTKMKNSLRNKDVKNVLDWVADKTLRTPTGGSKVLKYIIPGRKQMEASVNEEEEEDDDGGELFEG